MCQPGISQGIFSLQEVKNWNSIDGNNIEDVPADSVVAVSFSEVCELPKDMKRFKNLHSITFFLCDKMDINKELKKCIQLNNLIHLEILSSSGGTFPPSLLECRYLKSITLSGMKLGEIKGDFNQLPSLEELNFGHPFSGGSELKSLPSSLTDLSNLKVLGLWGNMEVKLDESFYGISTLKELNLTYVNHIEQERLFNSFPNLERLNLTGYSNKDLSGISQLKNLEHLEIYFSSTLESLGPDFNQLDKLTTLALPMRSGICSEVEMQKVAGLLKLESLELDIDLGNKDCFVFPSSGFKTLKHLKLVAVSAMSINLLNGKLAHLTGLETLMIDRFSGGYIPDEIFNLTNLKELSLYSIKIHSLSKSISNLKKLEKFELYNSKVTRLPDEFYEIDSLRELNIQHTPLDEKEKRRLRKVADRIAIVGM